MNMQRLSAPSLSILLYHRVLRQADPLFPEQVDARLFERQLGLLKRYFRPMPLLEAVSRLREGSLPARAACITFDDGYADNVQVALPLLQKHGLSACFFIATGYLDGGQMWNDSIIERVRHAADGELDLSAYGLGRFPVKGLALRRQAIGTILARLKYLPFDQRLDLVTQIHAGARYPSRPDPMMSSHQLLSLARAGMEIGGHTVSHPILSALSDRAARADIANGKRQLEAMTGAPVRLFAYPNGKAGEDYGPQHAQMVRHLGFEAALGTDWGVARPGADLYQLPRFTPWDRGRLRFLLRMGQNMLRSV